MKLGAKALERFRKVCGLLSSDHAGERSAAAAKATAILKAAGLTWESVAVDVALPQPDSKWTNHYGEAEAYRATAALYQSLLDDERKRNTRLQREIDRLKGIWPKGEPPRPDRKASAEAAE